MRALALHPDVLVVTSALLQVNCVIVRGGVESEGATATGVDSDPGNPVKVLQSGNRREAAAEAFVIDSPVLPDELDALPALLEQARFPSPSGLLVTHGDWDHMLGRLAFPGVALGCAESTAERLQAAPGEAQRELRAFDEGLMIQRALPLALGSVQALPVPGYCAVGDRELELHPAVGHTSDGMAVHIPWAGVLVLGDYLSSVEIPTLSRSQDLPAYLHTLERLRVLARDSEHIVTGHGPVLSSDRAIEILDQDADYLRSLRALGQDADLPVGRRKALDRRLHEQNVAALGAS